MATYSARHVESGNSYNRPYFYHNDQIIRDKQHWQHYTVDPAIEAFHKTLPDYAETAMHSVPSLASELGVAHVLVKDESTRLGLPAFKILGASWAVHRAVCQTLNIPHSSSLDEVRQELSGPSVGSLKLVTCTEGNWGRAVARMARYLGIEATIYVPGFMSAYTLDLLRAESAEVIVLNNGSYDDCIAATRADAERTGALMVMDTSWDGYETIPQVGTWDASCI